MLKFKLSYASHETHREIITHNVQNDIDLTINYTGRYGLSINGSGTALDPYVLTFSGKIRTSQPRIIIYDSDSYVQIRSSKNYEVFVNKSKNISLFDSEFRNLWVQYSFNINIKDLIVKNKTVLWKCEKVILEKSQVKLLYASKNNNITISDCLIKTIKTKKDDQEDLQIIKTQVDKVKTTKGIPVTT
jgi:hypothetical protein